MHWALRRDELCNPGLCPDAPEEDAHRCDHCPLDRLDAAQCAEKGLLIRRALDLMCAFKLAVHIGLDEIRGDEFCAILIIGESGTCWTAKSCRDTMADNNKLELVVEVAVNSANADGV